MYVFVRLGQGEGVCEAGSFLCMCLWDWVREKVCVKQVPFCMCVCGTGSGRRCVCVKQAPFCVCVCETGSGRRCV